ncbi:hypothetical protein QQF64_023408, partial [Cirrhinus molitorella]
LCPHSLNRRPLITQTCRPTPQLSSLPWPPVLPAPPWPPELPTLPWPPEHWLLPHGHLICHAPSWTPEHCLPYHGLLNCLLCHGHLNTVCPAMASLIACPTLAS